MEDSITANDRSFLFAHRVLMRMALSLVAVFAWIFVFQYYLAFSQNLTSAFLATIVVYALSQVILVLITPFSAAHLRGGVKRSMVFGATFAALAFAVLGATIVGYFSAPIGWGIILFAILLGAYRALYWIPYRARSARLAHRGTSHALFEFVIALMPLFAGMTLAQGVFAWLQLFFGAAVCMALSILPILPIQDAREGFSWTFEETFKTFFSRRNRMLMWRSLLSGIESVALFLLWPLAIFLIVGRSYVVMGAVLSASLVVVVLARDAYRRMLRKIFEHDSLVLTVVFAASGWIFRLVSGSPFMIVFADSYAYVHAPSGARELILHESPLDGGSYLDEFTALQEIGHGLGRIGMCVFVAVMLTMIGAQLTLAASLVVAAIAAGASATLAYTMHRKAY